MDSKERFYRQFQDSAAALQDQITQLSTFATVGGERQDAIEHILSGISRLSNEVADAADYVPAYDQRTYSDVIKVLKEQLNETTAAFAPKSRFRFKPRAAVEADATSPAAETMTKPDTRRLNPRATTSTTTAGSEASVTAEEKQDSISSLPTIGGNGGGSSNSKNYNDEIALPSGTKGGVRKPSFSTARDVALSDHEHVHILLPPSASRATSAGTLANLTRCVVDMSVPTIGGAAPFASLTLNGISSSVIVAGHVDGPVHITGVRDSVIVVTARQVRIHECENVVFYLHCVSRPIIEDCKGVKFAPAPESYWTDKEKQETNMWDQVDDFKWLKPTPSPNWTLVSEQDMISDETWKKTLIGNPGLGVDDILKILGVGKWT
ncbi:Tubulin-folding cofactor C [Madurella mycetomatis]|uniref:Tubulin-folding cofactor C n=1 Tax=Madurella mycetomatis TaxID=100816 RepID=A0A175W1A1_9PEZI|nr:Tubulin-folding cofactor C [Madurella mycetomatis]